MVNLVEKQATARQFEYQNKPIGSVDEGLQQNYKKGVVAGMRLAVALPGTLVETYREDFNERLMEVRDGS